MHLKASDIGLPKLDIDPIFLEEDALELPEISLFDLSSHSRARSALEFGLKMRQSGFNIFVMGEDNSGRMSATMTYLKQHCKNMSAQSDWIYLNNFLQPQNPKPFRLDAGDGRKFRDAMDLLLFNLRLILEQGVSGAEFLAAVQNEGSNIEERVKLDVEELRGVAKKEGFELAQTKEGLAVVLMDEQGNIKAFEDLPASERAAKTKSWSVLQDKLNQITIDAHHSSQGLNEKVIDLKRAILSDQIHPLIEELRQEFHHLESLVQWLNELEDDLLGSIENYLHNEMRYPDKTFSIELEERYSVNLFVDNYNNDTLHVILEPNPTYENLFGTIKYRASGGGYDTDYQLIRCGALHRANGGVLVLRAEGLANQHPHVWDFLKAALRDREVRIEELHRQNGAPLLDAPQPQAIPLDLKVIIVGAPRWYYAFFYNDPEFKNYFKIKAEIDPDLPSHPQNLAVYTRLLRNWAVKKTGLYCDLDAIETILGHSARWAEHRHQLTGKVELVGDIVLEAATWAQMKDSKSITRDDILNALNERRNRNARVQDRVQQEILEGRILIATQGEELAQVNGLTIVSNGEYDFGTVSKISAQVYPSDEGIINIERQIELGGPIQQKGVFIIEGFLKGLFADHVPLSFGCSLTFEQNYSDVEGDSASLAELLAVLSSLSGVAVRQDIAITGSMNQMGQTQAIGGVNKKIEGFFRLCRNHGLTGTQGVVVPKSNLLNLCLHEEVSQAIESGKFHIWSAETIHDITPLMMGIDFGRLEDVIQDNAGAQNTLIHKVYMRMKHFNQLLDSDKE